ncbi:glycosyltransferase family 2 protein [Salipiger sp.]|uniref:glycosyltransferase family 2 protein n=1 Tax=Salipiger sp. TaxID=2078585 RepID=UPI003A97266F
MDAVPVSVVIVSRGRPEMLARCLTGVSQLDHPAFEIVVVACPAGCAAVRGRPDAAYIRLLPFDRADISTARNIGIAHAAGEVLAFLDDDAVPEPTWLAHLCAPFETSGVAAAGGFVRGRNGIDFQWRGRVVTPALEDSDLPVSGSAPVILRPEGEAAVKLQGTNMAWRRSALVALGGFDPAFRFYLDDTDLDLRRHAAGLAVAIAPLAQVHHGFAPSARRRADRTPTDLTEIGASTAVFLRKHCPENRRQAARDRLREEQLARLLRAERRGRLGKEDRQRLIAGYDLGIAAGSARQVEAGDGPGAPLAAFRPYPGRPGAARRVLSGRVWNRRHLRAEAARLAAAGHIVSLYRFSMTALYHRVYFRPEGYWEQTGGLWGRSDRDGPLFRAARLASRVRAECARVTEVRDNPRDR